MINSLEVDSVILEYKGTRLLQNVYLKSETGMVTGLLGRNGSGKSSLMNIIFGELTPTNKSIRINKKTILGKHRNPSSMRYLPQFHITPKTRRVKKVFDDFRIDFSEFVELFQEFKNNSCTQIKNLSGGERRILEVYLILKSKTKFCLLDEPFSHLMPLHIERIKELINIEKKEKGIIITDHSYRHIIDISDTIYFIKNGTVFPIKNEEDLKTHGYVNH